MAAIKKTAEFDRIENLPKRELSSVVDNEELVEKWNKRTRKEGSSMSLWPIQAAALEEAYLQNGLFGPIGVGAGKTLISLLLPTAMNSKKAVILVPPKLAAKTEKEALEYLEHFNIKIDSIEVVKYSFLSSQRGVDILTDLQPDLIIADEAHSLKDYKAARTKRFLKYMKLNPGCRFVALSGTMTNKSVLDYAHLNELALRKNATVPNMYTERYDWANVLDARPREYTHPGPMLEWREFGESIRSAYLKRMMATKGVIATQESATDVELKLQPIVAPFHQDQKDQITKLHDTWKIGDEELTEAMDVARYHSQLASGFYYVWDWPNGVVDEEWQDARLSWAAAVREYLRGSRGGPDTPGLVKNAVLEGKIPELEDVWEVWAKQMHKPQPPTKPIHVSNYIVEMAKAWANSQEDGIIWYKHRAVAEILHKEGFDVYSPDRDPTGVEGVIVCSIKAHSTGKNLQYQQSNNLLLNVPQAGDVMEQLIGRTHRPGQSKPVTIAYLKNPYNDGALEQAMLKAEYMEQTMGQKQKLIYAKKLDGIKIKY